MNVKDNYGVLLPYKLDLVMKRGGDSVLDVGCGRGELVNALNVSGKQSTGVDLDLYPGMLLGSAISLPFVDKSFDTVVLFDVLEHLADPVKALKEASRVARSNILVSVPNNEVDVELLRYGVVSASNIDRTHVQEYSELKLSRHVEEAGCPSCVIWANGFLNPIGLALSMFWLPACLASKIGTAFNLFVPIKKFKGTIYAEVSV